jgi:hypothetical protein
MSNEVTEQIARMNEIAGGPLYVASSRECYVSGNLKVIFTTTVREGATAEMVAETKRHFLCTAKTVFEGKHIDATAEAWNKRTEYAPVVARHGEPRVCIYGDVVVKREADTVSISVNKFTEFTTARDMVNHLYLIAECIKLPVNGHASAQQPPAPPLDTATAREVLGNGGQRRVGDAPVSAPAASGQSDSGTLHFDQFPSSSEERTRFGSQYSGKVVSFPVVKIDQMFSKKDGKPEWQFYTSARHQHPSVYATLEYVKDAFTIDYLPKLPKTIEGVWRMVCYVNVKDTGKVYFNLIKVEPVDVPHGDLSSAPAQPSGDVDLSTLFTRDPFEGDADLGKDPLAF